MIRRAMLNAVGVRCTVPSHTGILLSFDDGPHPDVTPGVLDLLDEFKVKAAFFVVGEASLRSPEILARMVRAGHLIGNHTENHPIECSPGEYYRELAKCQRTIESAVGAKPRHFRPPLGILSPKTLVIPHMLGLRPVMWSTDTRDWSVQNLREAARAGKLLGTGGRAGDIVLLHDTTTFVIPLLRAALPILQQRGIGTTQAVGAF